jgi:hypothetical protein
MYCNLTLKLASFCALTAFFLQLNDQLFHYEAHIGLYTNLLLCYFLVITFCLLFFIKMSFAKTTYRKLIIIFPLIKYVALDYLLDQDRRCILRYTNACCCRCCVYRTWF